MFIPIDPALCVQHRYGEVEWANTPNKPLQERCCTQRRNFTQVIAFRAEHVGEARYSSLNTMSLSQYHGWQSSTVALQVSNTIKTAVGLCPFYFRHESCI